MLKVMYRTSEKSKFLPGYFIQCTPLGSNTYVLVVTPEGTPVTLYFNPMSMSVYLRFETPETGDIEKSVQ